MTNTGNSLSCERRLLLGMMSTIQFGRIKNLAIRNAQPVFDPPPSVVISKKAVSKNSLSRPRTTQQLKQQHRSLFACFDAMGEGVIKRLEIREGLPFQWETQESCSELLKKLATG